MAPKRESIFSRLGRGKSSSGRNSNTSGNSNARETKRSAASDSGRSRTNMNNRTGNRRPRSYQNSGWTERERAIAVERYGATGEDLERFRSWDEYKEHLADRGIYPGFSSSAERRMRNRGYSSLEEMCNEEGSNIDDYLDDDY